MKAYKPPKGVPKRPMRRQLRGAPRKVKPIKINQRKKQSSWQHSTK